MEFNQILGIWVFAFVGCILGAYTVWVHAPVVGGEWWPYIHGAVTIVGGFIGMNIGGILGAVMTGIAMWISLNIRRMT